MAARGDQIAKRAAAIAQQEQAKSTSGTEAPSNKVPFDFDKEWLHPDFKAVCQLPFDTQSSGVKFLRGIVFPKGFFFLRFLVFFTSNRHYNNVATYY